jgi:hypothetical protein
MLVVSGLIFQRFLRVSEKHLQLQEKLLREKRLLNYNLGRKRS